MPAGSAPERSVVTRSCTSCWVKLPSMMPESVMRELMTGAETHLVVEDDREAAADVGAGRLAEHAARRRR